MCPDCKNIDPKDSKDGKYGGKKFYCKAKHHYIESPCQCEMYKKAEGRKKEDIATVSNGMHEYSTLGTASGFFLLIVFAILGLLMWIFG